VDFDRTLKTLGPVGGSDRALVQNGNCASDSLFFSESDVHTLAQCAINSYNQNVQAQFLWNFQNQIEPRWSYFAAYDAGWIKQDAKIIYE